MKTLLTVLCLLVLAGSAHAFEFQIGVTGVTVDANAQTDSATAAVPFITFGPQFENDFALLFEATTFSYSATKSLTHAPNPSTGAAGLNPGDLDVSGTGYALIVQKKISSFVLRGGAGSVQYTFTNKLNSQAATSLQNNFAVTNYTESVRGADGTQILFGVDIALTKHFLVGLEHRDISVSATEDRAGMFFGTPFAYSTKVDLSATWNGIRLLLDF